MLYTTFYVHTNLKMKGERIKHSFRKGNHVFLLWRKSVATDSDNVELDKKKMSVHNLRLHLQR